MIHYIVAGGNTSSWRIYYNGEYGKDSRNKTLGLLGATLVHIVWFSKKKDRVYYSYRFTSQYYNDGITTKYPFH